MSIEDNNADNLAIIASSLQDIAANQTDIAANQTKQFKQEYQHSVEISNANSKGDLHITIKGRSDESLEKLVTKCFKEFKRIKETEN